MFKLTFFVFVLLISITSTAIVKWLPDTSFNLPINYKYGKLPCSKQTVVFEDLVDAPVQINSDNYLNGLILPRDGDLIFDGSLILGADVNEKCSDENAYYKPRYDTSWIQADVWASDRFNKATPDAERRPCYDDVVDIPQSSSFIMRFPDEKQTIKRFNNIRDLIQLTSNKHTFLWNKFYSIGISVENGVCASRAGCPCQKNMTVDCSPKHCLVPKCVNPIQPVGHCCHICGGFVTFKIDTETFDLMMFKDKVAETVQSYGYDLVYHIGRLPDNVVQVVVVDKGEYHGTSAEVVNEIKSLSYENGEKLELSAYSGSPLSESGKGLKIAFSMFFVVVIAMGGIYVYYYRLPEIRYPVTIGVGRSMISRFDRRTDSVVSLTSRRESVATVAPSTSTGFRNPLYDSQKEQAQEEEGE